MEAMEKRAGIPEDLQKMIQSTLVGLSIPELRSVKYLGSEDWQDLCRLGGVPKVFMVRQVVGFRAISAKLSVVPPESQWQNCSETTKSHLDGGAILSKAD